MGSRARNQTTITGPIPRMLDEALAWSRRTFDTTIVSEPDGTVHDRPTYPYIAFRELIANALVHRDLDHWSAGLAIEVRLRRDRLVISNPGGLYGITVERLGRDAVTSARNARLVAICQHVRSPKREHGSSKPWPQESRSSQPRSPKPGSLPPTTWTRASGSPWSCSAQRQPRHDPS
ncbi:ATP-binding protein [Streptomyces scopuliridis]|uniref:ATP-binding protein n=1 Tax=Streptomyces scopuliridis TaxID=452529 RepID=UPI0036AB1CAB